MYFRGMKKVVPERWLKWLHPHADGPDGEELEVCTEEAPFMFLGEDEALEAFEKRCLKTGSEPFVLTLATTPTVKRPRMRCWPWSRKRSKSMAKSTSRS